MKDDFKKEDPLGDFKKIYGMKDDFKKER